MENQYKDLNEKKKKFNVQCFLMDFCKASKKSVENEILIIGRKKKILVFSLHLTVQLHDNNHE